MANVFEKEKLPTNKPKRNVFDLSFANNLTLQFGALTPCFVKEVIPGDSFRIEPRMALKLMPMTFPVQTDMRAYVHFFYVRNRNLWKDWVNFIGMLPEGYTEEQMQKYSLPYLDFSASGIQTPRTGSLCDYMGLPTTIVGRYGQEGELTYHNNLGYDDVRNAGNTISFQSPRSKISRTSFLNFATSSDGFFNGDPIDFYLDPKVVEDYNLVQTDDYERRNDTPIVFTATNKIAYGSNDFVTTVVNGVNVVHLKFTFYPLATSPNSTGGVVSPVWIFGVDGDGTIVSSTRQSLNLSAYPPTGTNTIDPIEFDIADNLLSQIERFYIVYETRGDDVGAVEMVATPDGLTAKAVLFNTLDIDLAGDSFVTDLYGTDTPYYSSTDNNDDKALKINALPFRAYESIYNAFYRDPRNNPYMLNGSPEYNKWCPSVEGGVDANNYELHYRNWESDFLTTALPSPQQGQAPLVGVTNAGTLAFRDEEGTVYNASLEYSEDGEGLKGINVHASGDPVDQVTRIVDFATSGIAIADLRGVNALQRWLEINARRGYRYKDQVKSHFDVDIRFDELDMPEFIGGMSSEIYVNQISQTVNQGDSGTWQDTLGSYAGQGFTRNVDAKPISHYFDEHGYIIGIISVVPIPCYSQILPKHYLKRNPLDFYFPEFGKLGMQPITYNEVCPIQAFKAGGLDALFDTFGYQRAWYDYLASTDEVHGLFRLNMRNFLINRVFDKRPELSEDFLTVDPQQINNVFSVTETSDKIFGQLYFKVTAQRPIPEYGIPALE